MIGVAALFYFLQEDTRYIKPLMLWMSDSSRLSDNAQSIYALDVRFFKVIGQRAEHSQYGCPIVPGYRTTFDCYPSSAKRLNALAA